MQDKSTANASTRRARLAMVFGIAFVLFFSLTTAFAQRTFNVAMTGSLTFDPQQAAISAGDTVVWTNTSPGSIPHTATADSLRNRLLGFNSGSFPRKWLFPGDTFQFTFTTAGTYPYHCVLHNFAGMIGTITVNPPVTASKYSFTAAPLEDDDQILVLWTVPRSKERLGFRVLRSTGWDQQFVQVNEGVVRAQKETADGQEYQFIDANSVVSGTKYFYVLEEVRTDGQDSFRGPAIASPR